MRVNPTTLALGSRPEMRAVLGIDAAWTTKQPSGVAVALENADGWRLIAAAASYGRFHAFAANRKPADEGAKGSLPDASQLRSSASAFCGCAVDLVAIDMPLAPSPIKGRRSCDNAVSRAFGRHKCGTHSPSAERPGMISDKLREDFARAGYPLLTTNIALPGLIEVYPHPALVELTGASKRLTYKASKVRAYWPSVTAEKRRLFLYQVWNQIETALGGKIFGVKTALPELELDASPKKLKAYEDALDAIVCAWVAICALEGRAMPYGDEDSAIWVPTKPGLNHIFYPL
jgi:predicted RNase H-like nuclease